MLSYFVKLLLVLSVLFSNIALSKDSCFVGYTHTHHIISTGLNDSHPNAGCRTEHAGFQVFKNSFELTSVAMYGIYTPVEANNFAINFNIGVVTGYSRSILYKDSTYAPRMPFITDSLVAIVAPEIVYSVNKNVDVLYVQLGDAAGLGIRVHLNLLK